MKSSFVLMCALVLTTVAVAQEPGHLMVTVQTAPDATRPVAPAAGAKVIVVHWSNDGLHPTMLQDTVVTTNQMGTCTIQLPAGTYDVFVAASGLSPAAFRREVRGGDTTTLVASLKPAPLQFRPLK